MEYIKEVLKSIGIEPERIMMTYCSAAEGQKFQNEATKFDKLIHELGPNPMKSKKANKKKAKA